MGFWWESLRLQRPLRRDRLGWEDMIICCKEMGVFLDWLSQA